MPSFAQISTNDGENTPVAHVYIPERIDATGVARRTTRPAGIPAIGQEVMSVSVRRPPPQQGKGAPSATGNWVVRIDMDSPVLETVSNSTVSGIIPAPTISYVLRCRSTWTLPERSTQQQRKNLRLQFYNMIGLSGFAGKWIDELESDF